MNKAAMSNPHAYVSKQNHSLVYDNKRKAVE